MKLRTRDAISPFAPEAAFDLLPNLVRCQVGNCLKVLEAGGVNCEPFALLGLRGFWTMELKGGMPTTPNLLSLWPPPCGPRPHGSILYQLEMGSSQTLAQCTLSPGLEATFPFDPQKVVDADGMLQATWPKPF